MILFILAAPSNSLKLHLAAGVKPRSPTASPSGPVHAWLSRFATKECCDPSGSRPSAGIDELIESPALSCLTWASWPPPGGRQARRDSSVRVEPGVSNGQRGRQTYPDQVGQKCD